MLNTRWLTAFVCLKNRRDENLRNFSDMIDISTQENHLPGFAQCLSLLPSLILKKITDIIYHYYLK